MPKAIDITEENKRSLESQYDLEVDSLDGWEGLILVADFGAERPIYGYLNTVAFHKTFAVTGKKLDNGYYEVVRK